MRDESRLPLWLIPVLYVVATVAAGEILPRLEHAYWGTLTSGMRSDVAVAFFSSVSSGMMALAGIVFAIAFVMVQFGATAYSPRLVVVFGNDPSLFHTLGIFSATFGYSLAALAWTNRDESGTAPPFSTTAVVLLLIVSLLAFARLIHKLADLQIANVLDDLGERGRDVIHNTFRPAADDEEGLAHEVAPSLNLGPVLQTLTHTGRPRVVAQFDIGALVLLAQNADAVIALECAVGDTLIANMTVLRVHGAAKPIPEAMLMPAVRLARARTFAQDPKYAIRLLVDIAIRALSPAVNDPTTAVQALDQIEDLLQRLGRSKLDTGRAYDTSDKLRLVFPMPTWQDYLELAFDEIRQFGKTSIQVVRRLRSALAGLAESVHTDARRNTVRRYLDHLNSEVDHSEFDDEDRATARHEDRQGLGLSRNSAAVQAPVRSVATIAALLMVAAMSAARAQQPISFGQAAANPPGWTFDVAPYLWIATINAGLSFDLPPPLVGTLSSDPSIGFGGLMSHLNFAAMIAADARYDRFSLLTDFIYFNLGGEIAKFRSVNVSGRLPVPISRELQTNVSMRLNATEWTLAGGYTLAEGDWGNFDVIAGFRYIEVNSRTNYNLGLTVIGPAGSTATFGGIGSVASSGRVWNGIGGFRGRVRLGASGLFIPYYFDAGAGGSKLTWEIASGLGYHTRFADLSLTYRYLTWNQSSGSSVQRLSIRGPVLMANFTF